MSAIHRCWDDNPLKRPKENELRILYRNKDLPSLTALYQILIHTSRILDFKDLPVRIDFEEQELLVDKLILNKEIKERYKESGLCKGCKQPKTTVSWCQSCSSKRFQEEFKNWTSGNPEIDKFIQSIQIKANKEQIIEWIEYKNFENVEYLARGVELLREAELHVIANECGSVGVIRCYGITKNPETNEFMMIMERGINGSLRQYLDKDFSSLSWMNKLDALRYIVLGIGKIHERGLIHRDFHSGNMINMANQIISITDLGLCRPMNAQNNDTYGVLPYVAPEVLRGKEYTQASDIYGFGIIAYEICTGLPPYHDIAHDRTLAVKICQGLRPKSNYKIPQLILDIIHRCWDNDPLKRPKANELGILSVYKREIIDEKNTEICKQAEEADEINKDLPSLTALLSNTNTLSYTTHPQAIYTSRILDFKGLPESNLINLRIDSEDENN
ncbi:unnamed protein product [Rhizophagus irregularis]|nr:unnamed protein product [Rhizophagus irregularis]